MAEKTSDPVALWQEMFREMQKGFNSLANQAMSSQSFSRPASSDGESSTAGQQQLASFMERCFVSMNMPSRVQMAGIVVQLQAIEGQLDEIKALLREMQTASKAVSAAAPTPTPTPRPTLPTQPLTAPRSKRRAAPPGGEKQ